MAFDEIVKALSDVGVTASLLGFMCWFTSNMTNKFNNTLVQLQLSIQKLCDEVENLIRKGEK